LNPTINKDALIILSKDRTTNKPIAMLRYLRLAIGLFIINSWVYFIRSALENTSNGIMHVRFCLHVNILNKL